jgi:Protein of unknown function (DUF1553)/Protein of unknown function (DUF1549)
MIRTLRRAAAFLLPGLVTILAAGAVHARPAHKRALADYFGPFLAKDLNDCRTCHLPDRPDATKDDDSEKPHNPFGTRLKAVREELKKAGKRTSIPDRIEAVAEEDSDGDGVPNLLELLSGHAPGDPADKPTAAELARAREVLAAFRKSKDAYAWTPFEVVKRPPVPEVKSAAWVRNPIDAFLATEHESHGLTPRPEAPRAVLLRRVYLDLIGLPPTPEELHAFLEDQSPDAYEKVVDRLLASPQYGERWGRHWMDVWRYSDWAGYGPQVRDSQPHIWQWRDWIVESLNADKGYDRMVLEMLAGDELAPDDPATLRATGYLVRNYKLLSREKWMQDTVEHTAQAFLGITLGCARCHDHMFDPILQKEYYQVRAVFEPHQVRIDRVPGQLDTTKMGLPRVYDANLEVKTFLFIRGDDRNPDKTPLEPGVPEALGGHFPKVGPVPLPPAASSPDKRAFVLRETVQASETAISKGRETLQGAKEDAARAAASVLAAGALQTPGWGAVQKALDALALAELDAPLAEARYAALLLVLRVEELEDASQKDSEEWKQAATETALAQRKLAVLDARRNLLAAQQAFRVAPEKTRADAAKKVADAEKAVAKAEADEKLPPTTAYTKRPVPTYPATSTGRRLAFARWVADRDNPLTARVAMNHVWLRHFGQPIVPTVSDFGRNGQPPTHPALLDWMAAEFMESGWSMKHLHRLIVTSSAYRMASTPDAAGLAIDQDNKYLWRMPVRRVEAEVVRDCVFYVAGRLDMTLGGPDIDHTQGLTVPRRSLYFRHAQEKQMEFLKLFDAAAVTECYRRKESVVPQQALALANSELTLRHARLLARELAAKAGGDPAAFTTAAFERVLSRPPTAEELAECAAFLTQQTGRYTGSATNPAAGNDTDGRLPSANPALHARENLVHVLMNHTDFVTVR